MLFVLPDRFFPIFFFFFLIPALIDSSAYFVADCNWNAGKTWDGVVIIKIETRLIEKRIAFYTPGGDPRRGGGGTTDRQCTVKGIPDDTRKPDLREFLEQRILSSPGLSTVRDLLISNVEAKQIFRSRGPFQVESHLSPATLYRLTTILLHFHTQ